MKRSIVIAMGIGFLISTVLMAIPSANGWGVLEFPGIGASYLFSGAAGNSVIMSTAIGWVVNAVVYGLVVWIIISAVKISN